MKTSATPAPAFKVQQAAALGLPADLFGYTPADNSYWKEPGLPWANALAASETAWIFQATNDHMAPRFPAGTRVVAERVAQAEPLAAGIYLWNAGEGGETTPFCMGRFFAVSLDKQQLLCSLDKTGEAVACALRWEDPGFRLYRVVGYFDYPVF
ncbi:hypothetical protein GCM10023185_29760 [Hymenobacter saemangeumensis]|uniref:DUF1963 domain-containing protein n=1 Tax=Hymenobacter saemangeumensis TaxID=1084522 RepID=A0ABP8IL54_9BACT